MTETDAHPQRRRRLLSFSLRTLLVVMLAFGVWIGWLTQQAREQARAVAAFEKLGGFVRYDWEELESFCVAPSAERPSPPQPLWLRDLLGPHLFDQVAGVSFFSDARATDQALSVIAEMNEVASI